MNINNIVGFGGMIMLMGITYTLVSNQIGENLQKYDSPNFSKGKFRNLIETSMLTGIFPSIKVIYDSVFSRSKEAYPNKSLITSVIDCDMIESSDDVTVTWLGHSTALISLLDKIILTDPILNNKRIGPLHLGPKPFPYQTDYTVDDLPEIDIVLISHNHYDHLDKETIKELKHAKFYVPLGVKSYLVKWGIDDKNITELNWYEKTKSSDIDLTFAPTRHFSGRGLFDRNKTLWGSWIIQTNNKTILFGGDSGYFDEFKKIGKEYGPFDLVMLDSGQYNDAWSLVHMAPEETIQATIDLNAKAVMPIHISRYVLAMHSWYEPLDRITKQGEKSKVLVTTPKIGQTFKLNNKLPNERWWQHAN